MLLSDVAKKIKNYEIQGSDVAKYAIGSFKNFVLNENSKDFDSFIKNIEDAKKILFDAKKDPVMMNCINFAMKNLQTKNIEDAKKILNERIERFLNYKNLSEDKICEYGKNIIFQDAKILTHCYSKNVLKILKKSKKEGKNFLVINTETRPNFTGRMTSEEISNYKIKSIHIIDSAVAYFIKDIDFVLVGCDGINENGILNKIGTLNIAIIAKFYKKDFYVVAPGVKFYSNKFTEELRKKEEIWNIKNDFIDVKNVAYDFVDKNFITKVISEFGILNYDETIEKFKSLEY